MGKRFSERVGASSPSRTIQVESMDVALRNSLWNFLVGLFHPSGWSRLAEAIAADLAKVPVDELPGSHHQCMLWVKASFYKLKWWGVYDLVEYALTEGTEIVKSTYIAFPERNYRAECNKLLERESSGYRFIKGKLVPISNKGEVAETAEAIARSKSTGLAGAHEHLLTALGLLGKRPKPDYRNAIKEAISAVESVSKQISGTDSGGLKEALAVLSKATAIHGGLMAGFVNLYGYTSDEDGIRHAILDEAEVGFDEAKFMVVSCSAFVNYLIGKAQATGVL